MTGPDLEIRDGVDPRSPLFFVSYAHPRSQNPEPNRRFSKFYDDLQENVAELVSRPAGSDPGYMDQSIPDGVIWPTELLKAIGTCQVFIALLSYPYLDSEWCGKEWHAFSQRRVFSHPKGQLSDRTTIIPVIWAAPLRDQDIPPVVAKVQRFQPRAVLHADIAAQYNREGLVGLLLLDDDAYKAVVWRIAQRIAEITYNYRVEPGQFQFGELRNIFKEQGA